MNSTHKYIGSVIVGSGGSSTITFSSIPQTYTDLLVKYSLRCDTGNVEMYGTFNGNTSSVYTWKLLRGNRAVSAFASSDSGTSTTYDKHYIGWNGNTANSFGNGEMYIVNYTGSNFKPITFDEVSETNGNDAWMQLHAGLFSSTSAITSITFTANTGNFVQYSTAYLYGISNS